MKFKVGDKVIVKSKLSECEGFEIGDVGTVIEILTQTTYMYPISVELDKNKEEIGFKEDELEFYNETETKVQILKDEVGEYLDLELVRFDHKFNFQFYLNNIYLKNKDEKIAQSNGFTRVTFVPGQDIVFDLKKAESRPLKKKMTKKMTKEEIEKELGYKIEIVED